MKSFHSVFVGALAATTLAAACGGTAPTPQAPEGPATSASASAAPSASASSAQAPSPLQTDVAGPMTPLSDTTMAAELQALGLDPRALPPLNKLEPDKLRKVMRTFTKALGMRCGDCHVEADFAAPTPMKTIATHMWDDYVRPLKMESGAPLYCDSCHHGAAKILDRHDKKALSAWMDANYVGKLDRKDGKDHGCETCHGDPFEGHILAGWTK